MALPNFADNVYCTACEWEGSLDQLVEQHGQKCCPNCLAADDWTLIAESEETDMDDAA